MTDLVADALGTGSERLNGWKRMLVVIEIFESYEKVMYEQRRIEARGGGRGKSSHSRFIE